MDTKPAIARPHPLTTVIAAALSALIAIALLTGVAGLFQRDGTPFERVVVAEHACEHYAFASEREACVGLYLAVQRVQSIAYR